MCILDTIVKDPFEPLVEYPHEQRSKNVPHAPARPCELSEHEMKVGEFYTNSKKTEHFS